MLKAVTLALSVLFAASAQGNSLTLSKDLRTHHILPNNVFVGGNGTDITDFPYQVQVEVSGEVRCGGSILSESFVLTGALCTNRETTQNLSIRYGTNQLNDGGTTVKVTSVFQHPDFSITDWYEYDVTVLQLAEPIKFSETAQPITLTSREPGAGDEAVVSGWGTLEEIAEQQKLQSLLVSVINRYECNKILFNFITENMFCTLETGTDNCYYDHGGPLVINGTQYGIISWGVSGGYGYLNTYSNVATLRSFIDEVTGGSAKWV